MNSVNLEQWLDAIAAAGKELAGTVGADSYELLERMPGIPREFAGSCIALVGNECSAQVAFCSSAEGAKKLARMMLAMDEDEELEDDALADAICELANILAGLVKTKVAPAMSGFQLGMPVFVRGSLAVPADVQAGTVEAQIGGVRVYLLVLRSMGS